MRLITGIELVKDRTTKKLAGIEVVQIFEISRYLRLLIGKGRSFRYVLRIMPQMRTTRTNVDYII